MIFTLAQQFSTLLGLLTIVPTGHGAVCLKLEDKIIYIDPYSQTTDYTGYPKADIIFFTHDHYDHYDTTALKHLVTAETVFVGPPCMEKHLTLEKTMKNGDSYRWENIEILAVPAYNILNKRPMASHSTPKDTGTVMCLLSGILKYIFPETQN